MIRGEIRGANELRARLDRLVRAVQRDTREALAWGQQRVADAIQTLLRGPVLARRSGNLVGSVGRSAIDESSSLISGSVGTDAIYACIQNYGGTITAKNGALTIPLDEALAANGSARYSAREVISSPRIGGLRRVFFRKGVLLGSQGRSVTPLFAMRASVTIRGRGYMETGLESECKAIEARFAQGLADAIDTAEWR